MEVAVGLTDKLAKDELPEDKVNPLSERMGLASSIELILKGDEHAPELLASLFIGFREAINGGLRGINETSDALLAGVELIYLHSSAHVAALKLYLLAQEGQLRVEDEPLNVLGAAIARSTGGAERERFKASSRARRRRG